MELVADVLDNLLSRAATGLAGLDFAGAPVNDFLPLRFGVSVHGVVETGDKLPGKERPFLFRQGRRFGHFLSRNAHAAKNIGVDGHFGQSSSLVVPLFGCAKKDCRKTNNHAHIQPYMDPPD
jgi:hypothetical protein